MNLSIVNRKIALLQVLREHFPVGIKTNRHCNARMYRAIPPNMEQQMKYLNKLKLVAQQQKRMQSKAEHRRSKVIEKLEEQLAMAEALNRGESYSKTRRVWKTNEAGERVQIDRAKRVRSWFWVSAAGCFLSVWYGSKVVELEPGLTAIQIGKRDDLPDAIRNVIEAVRAGELDIAIEAVAEKGIPEIKLHSTSKKQRAAASA